MQKRLRNERGNALIESAITVPIILLIAVGIFEFGRAYQTQQVLTNAAREGARQAVLEGVSDATVTGVVRTYLTNGGLTAVDPVIDHMVSLDPAAGGCPCGSQVTINYPFSFIVLQPVAKLVVPNSKMGSAIPMQASALMRNE